MKQFILYVFSSNLFCWMRRRFASHVRESFSSNGKNTIRVWLRRFVMWSTKREMKKTSTRHLLPRSCSSQWQKTRRWRAERGWNWRVGRTKINNSAERSAEKAKSEERAGESIVQCRRFPLQQEKAERRERNRESWRGSGRWMYSKCDAIRNENSWLCSLTNGQKCLLPRSSRFHSNGNIITFCCFDRHTFTQRRGDELKRELRTKPNSHPISISALPFQVPRFNIFRQSVILLEIWLNPIATIPLCSNL